jgi:hypothetical protein
MLFKKVFFWCVGLFGLIGILFLPEISTEGITPEKNKLYTILFKIAIGNFSIVLLFFPTLIDNGYITRYYYDASRFDKAKSDLIMMSLLLPGIILLSYIFLSVLGGRNKLLLLVLCIAAYRFFECIFVVLCGKHEE